MTDNEIHQEWESAQNTQLETTLFQKRKIKHIKNTLQTAGLTIQFTLQHLTPPLPRSGTNRAEPKAIHTPWTALEL